MKRKISIGRVVVYVVLCLYALVVAAPLLLMIVTSLKENLEFMKAPLALPKGLNLSGYATVFSNEQFFRSILNSAIVAIVSLAVSLTVSILLSYALARYRGRWVRRWYMFFLVGMIVPIRLGVLFFERYVQQTGAAQLACGPDLRLYGDVDPLFHVHSHRIHQNDPRGTGRRGLHRRLLDGANDPADHRAADQAGAGHRRHLQFPAHLE